MGLPGESTIILRQKPLNFGHRKEAIRMKKTFLTQVEEKIFYSITDAVIDQVNEDKRISLWKDPDNDTEYVVMIDLKTGAVEDIEQVGFRKAVSLD